MIDPKTALPTPTAMGRLELAVYRQHYRAALRRRRADRDEQGEHDDAAVKNRGFGSVRYWADEDDMDVDTVTLLAQPLPGRAAAQLLLARAFDASDGLAEALKASEPVVVLVELPDPDVFARAIATWRTTLGLDGQEVVGLEHVSARTLRSERVAIVLLAQKPLRSDSPDLEARSLIALQSSLPVVVLCPIVAGHVPEALVETATHRIIVGGLDDGLVARVVGAVTGSRIRAVRSGLSRVIGLRELIMAVRADRKPAECLALLERYADGKRLRRDRRELSLDELHGLDAVVSYARDLIKDLEAWKRQAIPWAAVGAEAVFAGPSGTGKTSAAAAIARGASAEYTAVSLARWQSAKEGHLGHLLAAMAADFNAVRAKPKPHFMIIDECDSLGNRDAFAGSSFSQYHVEVVNAALEQLDGLSASNEGIVFIGCTNHVERLDPALLRPGRLSRVISVGLPDADSLEKMFRVRLGQDLQSEDLRELSLLSLGATGADVESTVKDARRIARNQNRELVLDDLIRAVAIGGDLDDATRRRAAAHEAGHILADVILFGAIGINAVLGSMRGRAGVVVRNPPPELEGTYEECHRRLQMLLAGRAAEDLLCGSVSQGAGGRKGGSDLEKASAIAASMVGALGLAGPRPLLWLAGSDEPSRLMAFPEVRSAANAELKKADAAVRALLSRNSAALRTVAIVLAKEGRIDGVAVERIVRDRRKGSLALRPPSTQVSTKEESPSGPPDGRSEDQSS